MKEGRNRAEGGREGGSHHEHTLLHIVGSAVISVEMYAHCCFATSNTRHSVWLHFSAIADIQFKAL